MRPATQIPTVIRFDHYELDLATEELRKNGFSLKLQPQPFKILAYLSAHPGALVSRQELRDHVWPGDTFVDFDLAINQAIKQIRAVLNDDAESPRVIATFPRRGYRFIPKVEAPAPTETSSRPLLPEAHQITERKLETVGATARNRRWIPLTLVVSATLLLLVAVIGYRMARTGRPTGQMRMVVLPFQNLTGDPGQEYFA